MQESIPGEKPDSRKYRYFIMKTKLSKLLIPEHWTMVGEIEPKYICEDVLVRPKEAPASAVSEDVTIELAKKDSEKETEPPVNTDVWGFDRVEDDVMLPVIDDETREMENPNPEPMVKVEIDDFESSKDSEISPEGLGDSIPEVVRTIYPSTSSIQESERSYSASGRSQRVRKPSSKYSGQVWEVEGPSNAKALQTSLKLQPVSDYKSLLKQHIAKVGLQPRSPDPFPQYQCAQCDRYYDSRGGLSRHYKAAHKMTPNASKREDRIPVIRSVYKSLLSQKGTVATLTLSTSDSNRPYVTAAASSSEVLGTKPKSHVPVDTGIGQSLESAGSAVHDPLLREEFRENSDEHRAPDHTSDEFTWTADFDKIIEVSTRASGVLESQVKVKSMESLLKAKPVESLLNVKPVTFPCGVCSKLFTDQKKRDVHCKEHSHSVYKNSRVHEKKNIQLYVDKSVLCTACGKRFRTNGDLSSHLRIVHWKCTDHRCSFCGMRFATKSYLTRHVRLNHAEPGFGCDNCGLKFRTASKLRVHRRVHTQNTAGEKPVKASAAREKSYKSASRERNSDQSAPRPHACEECGAAFRTMRDVCSHKNHQHQQMNCPTCDQTFPSKTARRRHQRQQHGYGAHFCEFCGKYIAGGSNNFEIHKRIHTGEKPFICTGCGKMFRRAMALKAHERIHTGEKPYSCDICHKKFREKKFLESHRRFHTKEKPFLCPKCGRRFGYCGNFYKHRSECCGLASN